MKKTFFILATLAGMAAISQAATTVLTTTTKDPANLKSGGRGVYWGFSFTLDPLLVESGDKPAVASDIQIQSMDLAYSPNGGPVPNGGGVNVYVTIFSSTSKGESTFVGQSTNTVNMPGVEGGTPLDAASWVTANFADLTLNTATRYYLAFTTTQVTSGTDWSSVAYSQVRLRIGDAAAGDGVDVGDIYTNSAFTTIQTGSWGPEFKVTLSDPVPEPATATLGLLGLAGLMVRRRRS